MTLQHNQVVNRTPEKGLWRYAVMSVAGAPVTTSVRLHENVT